MNNSTFRFAKTFQSCTQPYHREVTVGAAVGSAGVSAEHPIVHLAKKLALGDRLRKNAGSDGGDQTKGCWTDCVKCVGPCVKTSGHLVCAIACYDCIKSVDGCHGSGITPACNPRESVG